MARPSIRSIRVRWHDVCDENSAPGSVKELLAQMVASDSIDYEILSSIATYHGIHHATATFRNGEDARRAFHRVKNINKYSRYDCDMTFNGLTLLQSPRDWKADICAIHGYEDNAIDTFTGRSKIWLRDIVPTIPALRNTRTMIFGYNSGIERLENRMAIEEWAVAFLQAVSEVRANQDSSPSPRRPILFICHSMGGLVVRKVIELLQGSIHTSNRYPGLSIDDCGIIFLSTPHLGTSRPECAGQFCQLTSCISGLDPHIISSDFQVFNASIGDSKVGRLWANLLQRDVIACFCEGRETKIGSSFTMITTPETASFMTCAATRITAADYYEVCKYDNDRDPGFKDIVEKLIVITQKLLYRDYELQGTTANYGDVQNQAGQQTIRGSVFHGPVNYYTDQIPGHPRATAYRYPLPKDKKWYVGAPLKSKTGRFRGRQEIINALQEATRVDVSSHSNKVIALSGIGGIGKTEILLEYGLQARQSNHIFYHQARPGENFLCCVAKLANIVGAEVLSGSINLAEREATWTNLSQTQRAESFIAWLQDQNTEASIILFDDIDSFEMQNDMERLSNALKAWPHNIILTTRDPNLGSDLVFESDPDAISNHQTVGPVPEEELVAMMRRYAGSDLMVSKSDLEAIARVVGGHAMAAYRAVQYMSRVLALSPGVDPVHKFLQAFKNNDHQIRKDFMDFRPQAGRSLTDCFEVSIQRLRGDSYQSRRVLILVAFLQGAGVDFRFFLQHRRPWLAAVPGDRDHLISLRDILELSDTERSQILYQLIATSALIRAAKGELVMHPLMREHLLQRGGQGARIIVLRQILLLTRISLRLEEGSGTFELFDANCLRVADDFQVKKNDVLPSAELLQTIHDTYMSSTKGTTQDLTPSDSTDAVRARDLHELHARLATMADKFEQAANSNVLDEERANQFKIEVPPLAKRFDEVVAATPLEALTLAEANLMLSVCRILIKLVTNRVPLYLVRMQTFERRLTSLRSIGGSQSMN